MATTTNYNLAEIKKSNKMMVPLRSIIETAFYGNNVTKVNSISEAYKMAKESPGTIVTDMPVHRPEEQALAAGSKVLLFNDGAVTGRYAAARVIQGEEGFDEAKYTAIARETVYRSRHKKLYHAQAIIGLHPDFMVRAHLLVPETHENLMYSWLLNFQFLSQDYMRMYKESKSYPEGDIYVFADPDCSPEAHPDGLALFDSEHNTAMILGMRYFGELKKGTLTLAWAIANRNGFAACHGGMKQYCMKDGSRFTVGVFGLSGSGKSTITHERHNGKHDITILHDDAYVISTEAGSSIALEPSYFDKTQDYPTAHAANKYLLTVQNCGATLDAEGNKVIVAEDIRNGNGRAVKSRFLAENRVDRISEPVDAIIWLMKDDALPPVVKVGNPVLASVLGAVLATKRSSAERIAEGAVPNALVIEPYANPFRTYPLSHDYEKFKKLFQERQVDCYIFNTGHFLDKKIPKETTLEILEMLASKNVHFKKFGDFEDLQLVDIEGFIPEFDDLYNAQLKQSIDFRIAFLENLAVSKGGRDKLPDEAFFELQKLQKQIEGMTVFP